MTTFEQVPDYCRHTLARLIALDGKQIEVTRAGIHSGNRDPFRALYDLGLASSMRSPAGRKEFARITTAGRALKPDVEAWQAAQKAARERFAREAAEEDALRALAPRLLAYVRERMATDPAALELATEYGRQVEAYLAD
ncbi:MAG: hypothetical protein B7Y80_01615 [Hyphomicrobium sp. 32-62-53]|nr:MAG: hypothetical protein B7Z29_01965 [Hyphomicrobium sp. 12-62-95]OYY01452.1 MAG: hypothetical protein B7Y80_01615 [Hyphomicrobium sp. 32-62-53]